MPCERSPVRNAKVRILVLEGFGWFFDVRVVAMEDAVIVWIRVFILFVF